MRKRIKLLCMICMFVLLLPSIPVYAYEQQDNCIDSAVFDAINEALSFVELDKASFGLSDVDFDYLDISNPVSVYEYNGNSLEKVREFYPIVYNGRVVATAGKVGEGNKYCIETYMANAIDRIGCDEIAVIYDSLHVYLYSECGIFSVLDYGNVNDEEKTSYLDVTETLPIGLTDISSTYSLCYNEYANKQYNRDFYYCAVSYVPQYPYLNLCWAATVACIKNYLSGTSYTVDQIAMMFKSTTYVVDATNSPSDTANKMQYMLNLSYTYSATQPGFTTITNNISNNYPIYGCFFSTANPSIGHAGTVYAISNTGGYIYVMDPKSGSVLAPWSSYWDGSSNHNYFMYAPAEGGQMLLNAGICHSW